VAPTAHDMPREYKLLSIINPHFPLAPKPTCNAKTRLLWRSVLSDAAPPRRHRAFQGARQIGENLELRKQLSETVVDTLVALHAIDVLATGIVNIGKPRGLLRARSTGGPIAGGARRLVNLPKWIRSSGARIESRPDGLIHFGKFTSLRAPPAIGHRGSGAQQTPRLPNVHNARRENINGVQSDQRVHHGLTQLLSQFQVLANLFWHLGTHDDAAAALASDRTERQ